MNLGDLVVLVKVPAPSRGTVGRIVTFNVVGYQDDLVNPRIYDYGVEFPSPFGGDLIVWGLNEDEIEPYKPYGESEGEEE
jgi:hypothetical protein